MDQPIVFLTTQIQQAANIQGSQQTDTTKTIETLAKHVLALYGETMALRSLVVSLLETQSKHQKEAVRDRFQQTLKDLKSASFPSEFERRVRDNTLDAAKSLFNTIDRKAKN